MKSQINSWKLGFFIVSATIGAGFASGKEISTFFAHFGLFGIFLACICTVLFFMTCTFFLKASQKMTVNQFGDVFTQIFPRNGKWLNGILFICFTITVGSMLAGSNALGSMIFPTYNGIGIGVVSAILAGVLVMCGLSAIHRVNFFIVPFLWIMLFVTTVLTLVLPSTQTALVLAPLTTQDFFLGFGSSILYVSLNMLSTGFLLLQMGKTYAALDIRRGSIIFSVLIGFLMIIISQAVIHGGYEVYQSEMPILQMAYLLSPVWFYVMCGVVWLAIFTTIVSDVFMLAGYLQTFVHSNWISVAGVLGLAVVVSAVGFGNIVKYIYPALGLMGLLTILLLLKQIYHVEMVAIFKTKKTPKNKLMQK